MIFRKKPTASDRERQNDLRELVREIELSKGARLSTAIFLN